MFWELRDTDGRSGLVIIGLDSGMTANLDGYHEWWSFWKHRTGPDEQQHNWLEARLARAQAAGDTVMILFHIPALVREVEKEKHLKILHGILARYTCVRAILSAHEHNFQLYTPRVFQQFIIDTVTHQQFRQDPFPHYIVAGAGGAALEDTTFSGPYGCTPYPTADQWRKIANRAERVLGRSPLRKSLITKLVARVSKSQTEDADLEQFLSFVLVDAGAAGVTIRPVFLDDLQNLFSHLPDGTDVDVMSEKPPVNPASVQQCLKAEIQL